MALRTLTRNRGEVNDKLAFRIAIAGVKGFAIARTALNQLTLLALRASNRCFIWLIDKLSVLARRILATSDKHTEAPLAECKLGTTFRTHLPLQELDDMSIRLTLQGTDIVTLRIVGTAKKRPVFPGPYYQFSPTLWTGLIFTHCKEC